MFTSVDLEKKIYDNNGKYLFTAKRYTLDEDTHEMTNWLCLNHDKVDNEIIISILNELNKNE